MKKLVLLFIVLTMVIGSTTFVYAESEPKTIDVVLSDTPSAVEPGEAVTIEAVCKRNGSSYDVVWGNAVEVKTVYSEETGCYTSEAIFQADNPGIYTISYEITMNAGNSSTTFSGRVERTIEVIGSLTLKGAEIRELTVTPAYQNDGSIAYYNAAGKIYTLWSDGTSVLYGSIYFCFGANETSKNINVRILEDDNQYIYAVTVNR